LRMALRIDTSLRMLRPPMPPSSVCRPPKDARRIPSLSGCEARRAGRPYIQSAARTKALAPHTRYDGRAEKSARVAVLSAATPTRRAATRLCVSVPRARALQPEQRAGPQQRAHSCWHALLRRSASFSRPRLSSALDDERLQEVALGGGELLL